MKVALVHELLTQRGGAERVLQVLAEMFPEAPIYTFLYNEKLFGSIFPTDRVQPSDVIAKRSQLLPPPYRYNHHLYLKHFPTAAEAWDFSGYDLVISSSSAFAHGIITNGKPKHISYIHSPARYLWDRTHDVQKTAGSGLLGGVKQHYLQRRFHNLRIWDAEAAGRADLFLAASKEVQRRIELYWRQPSKVLHPPIADDWFTDTAKPNRERTGYLVVSTLAAYKRIELAIEACNDLQVPLTIAGDGPYRGRLEALAGPTINFVGYTDTAQLKELYSSARAVLFPGAEDFGLVPIEAAACGTPTIAYRTGGALETVREHETGIFFDEPTATSLADAMKKSEQINYSYEQITQSAKTYQKQQFVQAIETAVETITT